MIRQKPSFKCWLACDTTICEYNYNYKYLYPRRFNCWLSSLYSSHSRPHAGFVAHLHRTVFISELARKRTNNRESGRYRYNRKQHFHQCVQVAVQAKCHGKNNNNGRIARVFLQLRLGRFTSRDDVLYSYFVVVNVV